MPITDVYNLADDALQNMFNVSLTKPSALGIDPPANIDLRVTEFEKPEVSFGTYEVHYKTLKIVKPSGKTEFSNEFSFSIRVDRNYEWYKFFEQWNAKVLDLSTGALGNDNSLNNDNFRGTMIVQPTYSTGSGYKWQFDGVLPKTVPSISFSQEAGDAVVAQLTFICTKMTPIA